MKIHCINAKNPDHNGIYRKANIAQTKHHWWWKVNTVFDQLQVVKNYTGKCYLIICYYYR